MEQEYIRSLLAERIGGERFGLNAEMYKFAKIKRAKQEAQERFPDMELIDLGVGEPDQMADAGVVAVLAREAAKPENRFYADNGTIDFKQAAAQYMRAVFGVEHLDANTEINHVIGSKSGLALLPYAFIHPGDITMMPSPGYDVLATHTTYLGGEVFHVALREENQFLPDLDAIPADVCARAKLLYLNYPNNPTGATATAQFFAKVVQFARKHRILVVHDAAYAALVFSKERALSFLSIPGAKEVGVELHSLSKAFNMTGWRIGFIAGNALAIQAFASVKNTFDSGQFLAIQRAGIYALQHPEITEAICAKYSRRHDLLAAVLREVGFQVRKPKGSFFLYARAPRASGGGPSFASAEAFSQYLIREKLISTVPWDDAGAYIRFSVTFAACDEAEERRIITEVKRRLAEMELVF